MAQAAKEDMRAAPLMEMPDVGKFIATAVLAAVAEPRHFKQGRDFAANLSITPSEHSSGSKQRLGHIAKSGDA